jgi:fumarylpyruvate hydrolase|tara:strand:+ start:266 stop:955 length:690 start_codon:yes stop_codon:yes gene_type:complete
MSLVIEPVNPVTLPVKGSPDLFPVGQIYCVGRNYADHAIEMGHDPNREAPFFFMKPVCAILQDGEEMRYPAMSSDVHHEVELVVALGKGGQRVSVQEAMGMVFGYAVGIDMTRRDLQAKAKEKGRPWEAAKSFKHSAPCSAISPMTKEVHHGLIQLSVNGNARQGGNINQMIWKVPEVISRLSELFVLDAGDLIFTGTPAGVGPIAPGDCLEASIAGVGVLSITIGNAL